MQIISWYTPEYEKIFNDYFALSCLKADVNFKAYSIPSLKNWKDNTNLKPMVAIQAMKDVEDDILLVDADAKVYSYPSLLEDIPQEYDCGIFYLNWKEWYQNGSDREELCSGTLYFRNRPICIELLKEWKRATEVHSKHPDQRILEVVLRDFKINIYKLPYTLCWINSLPRGGEPIVKRPDNVIVEHFQASREMKGKIK